MTTQEAPLTLVPAQERPSPPSRPRILVVDDDDICRTLCARVLGAVDADVIHATDGHEGLGRATEELPDLIITDVNMPRLNGLEFARALRLDHRTRDVPIIFLTGETDVEVRTHAYAAGALAFLLKPFDPAALRDVICHALGLAPATFSAPDAG